MNLSLAQALRVKSSACVAFIGAGGKTTAMFRLARALSKDEGTLPVIVTATSHLGVWQTQFADQHIVTETPAPLENLEHGLNGVILVTGEIDGDRTKPIHNDLLHWLHEFCSNHSIPLLIEADGARQKPLKAWKEHEPPIPSFADLVVEVVGLTGLGKLLSEENVHRSEIFAKLSGLKIGEQVTSEALVRVLEHEQGGLKNIAAHTRRVILLNQADTPDLQSTAQALAQALLSAFDSAIIASLEQGKIFAVQESIAGIILAAGGSTRFGQPKQLLNWKGQPFVRAVAKTALEAGLSPIIVVTGSNAEQVEHAVEDLNVMIVRNEEWTSGQGSSIKVGIKALTPALPSANTRDASRSPKREEEKVGGAIFLLIDQPQITTSILRALVEKHAEGLHPVIAPLVIDQRANPVLFDCVTFTDLMRLQGDVGGRAILHKYRMEYLPWHDDRLLLDVDTPEMYQRLISDETL